VSYRPWVPGGQAGRDYAVVLGRGPCAGRFTLGGSQPIWVYWQATTCHSLDTVRPYDVLRAAKGLLARQPAAIIG
jgi:hypothetical protein